MTICIYCLRCSSSELVEDHPTLGLHYLKDVRHEVITQKQVLYLFEVNTGGGVNVALPVPFQVESAKCGKSKKAKMAGGAGSNLLIGQPGFSRKF